MPKIGGDGFDVHAVLYRQRGVRMAQIVEAHLRQSHPGHNLFELLPDCVRRQVLPILAGKDEIVCVLKQLPVGELPFGLLAPGFLQGSHDAVGHGKGTVLFVFKRREHPRPAFSTGAFELPIQVNGFVIPVDAIPAEADQLALPHARKDGNVEQLLKGVALNRFQKRGDFLILQRTYFLLRGVIGGDFRVGAGGSV